MDLRKAVSDPASEGIVDKLINSSHLPLDVFLYIEDYALYVGTSGRGGKLLPPAARAALNASPGVKARRARHDFHPSPIAKASEQECSG
jgi:hypothetical protein